MNVLKLVNREIDISPFAVKTKQDPISLGTAGIIAGGSALSSLLGGLFGSSSNKSANETNLEVAKMNQQSQRETNEMNKRIADAANYYNYKMFNEQNAFNLDMWNKQNQYNLPVNQVARLKAAGINPVFGLGNVSEAGQLSSAQAAPAERAQMTAPQLGYHQQPYDPTQAMQGAANSFLQALNWKTSSDVGRSQVNYNNAQAENIQMNSIANLSETLSRTKKNTAEYEMIKQSLALAKRTMEDQVAVIHNQHLKSQADIDKTREETAVLQVQRKILSIQSHYTARMSAAQLRAMDAGIAQTMSAIRLNDANAANAHAMSAVNAAQEAGLKLDNKQKEKLQGLIVAKAREEVFQMEDERKIRPFRYNYEFQGKGGQYFPLPSGQYGAKAVFDNNQKRDRFRK